MKLPKRANEDALKSISIDEQMVIAAITAASVLAETEETPQNVEDVDSSGAHFTIPVLIPEDTPSGDGREFVSGSLTTRDLPLPLMWQISTGDGHDGSFIVARIDSIDRISNGLGNAKGVFDTGPYGREAQRLVKSGFLRGISADLDQFEASVEQDDPALATNGIKNRKVVATSGRVMGATLVPKPAFQECFIILDEDPSFDEEDDFIPDGEYEDSLLDDVDNELAALAASSAPVIPPRGWFTNPKLNEPTPLTIDDDGKVYGHIASWNTDHIGLPRGTKAPRSASKYAYFRTGVLRTDDGTDVQVGQLTLVGGHAPLSASASEAVKHYDDTNSAVADVIAGEDAFGIWVAGALRPDLTPSQVRAFRASAPSGDWRPIGRNLELVAVCAVNCPGFPVARTIIAGGQQGALVAAGAAALMQIREEKSNTLEDRLAKLESLELYREREKALAKTKDLAELSIQRQNKLKENAELAINRLNSLKEEKNNELSIKIENLVKRIKE